MYQKYEIKNKKQYTKSEKKKIWNNTKEEPKNKNKK